MIQLTPELQQLIKLSPAHRKILLPCVKRGKEPRFIPCGVIVFSCETHGTCSCMACEGIQLCQKCDDYQGPPDVPPR